MAGKLDTQGWIDATRSGCAYAFFLRDEILWVRRNGKYKRTQVSGINTIAGVRAMAGSIAGEKEDWMDALKDGPAATQPGPLMRQSRGPAPDAPVAGKTCCFATNWR